MKYWCLVGFLQLVLPHHWKILSQNLSSFGFGIQSCGKCTENTMSKMQHWKSPHFLSFKELYSSFIVILIFWITCSSEESVQSYLCLHVNFLKPFQNSITTAGVSFAPSHYLWLLKAQLGAVKFWQIWALGAAASQAAHWQCEHHL